VYEKEGAEALEASKPPQLTWEQVGAWLPAHRGATPGASVALSGTQLQDLSHLAQAVQQRMCVIGST
jgi:hypothetical protein